jgi:hypothetical protein
MDEKGKDWACRLSLPSVWLFVRNAEMGVSGVGARLSLYLRVSTHETLVLVGL